MTPQEIFALVRRHGADPGADRVATACGLVESGGRTDAVGDSGHSIGLWQMHDQGLGAGMTVAERADPDTAAAVMVPVFNKWWREGQKLGYADEQLARYTAMFTERPEGFDDLHCPAADAYAAQWRGLAPSQSSDAARRVWQLAGEWAAARVPYALEPGAVTRSMADCSGLIVGVFREAGLPWPAGVRTVDDLVAACAPVAWDAVQLGDLLIFEKTYVTPMRYTHVGISHGVGSGQMLDTNDARGFPGVTDITTDYWQSHLVLAVRPPQYATAPEAAAPSDLAAQLAAEKAWGTALLAQLEGWAGTIQTHLDEIQKVLSTMRSNAGGQ